MCAAPLPWHVSQTELGTSFLWALPQACGLAAKALACSWQSPQEGTGAAVSAAGAAAGAVAGAEACGVAGAGGGGASCGLAVAARPRRASVANPAIAVCLSDMMSPSARYCAWTLAASQSLPVP